MRVRTVPGPPSMLESHPDWHIEVDMPGTVYEVRVQGEVGERVEELFNGASVTIESVVRAALPDQAALYGLLAWIDRLGLELIDVRPSGRRSTDGRR